MTARIIEDLLSEQAVRFLQQQSTRLARPIRGPRPWHYGELHNPWGRAATLYDSWGFLKLCETPALLDAIAALIGEDVILFDSQWLPERPQPLASGIALESDAHRFPVDPPRGVTALLAFADSPAALLHLAARTIELQRASVLLIDSAEPFQVHAYQPDGLPPVFAARYFPSPSRYLRDPSAPVHRALTERYPLFNYARMPLWLVRGEDRGQNDFVTGFNTRAGFWTTAEP